MFFPFNVMVISIHNFVAVNLTLRNTLLSSPRNVRVCYNATRGDSCKLFASCELQSCELLSVRLGIQAQCSGVKPEGSAAMRPASWRAALRCSCKVTQCRLEARAQCSVPET